MDCPSIKEKDLLKLSVVVARLEQAESGYALLHKLSEYGPEQLDDLHRLLADWTLDMAKVVLDEIGRRLLLVEELQTRMGNNKTQEVLNAIGEEHPVFKIARGDRDRFFHY